MLKVCPSLHEVGCLGKITNFKDTSDGRYLIDLSGIQSIQYNTRRNQK